MTKLPTPRFDLLKVKRYATASIQFSRGCPFLCEFCDIIVTFGRRPRMKRPEQIIQELEQARRLGFLGAFIVDDNFIGNKKAAKELLRMIVGWQQRHGYPLRLNTEASVNLADDAELLDLMYKANFRAVFIGIETPRAVSLKETKKYQNVARDGLESKLARIQNAGLEISAGFIVGFDNDDAAIFEDQYQFIQSNGIAMAMVGILTAIPKTPLYERLKREGRLRTHDINCNFVPKQMSPERLREGYWDLLRRLYAPQAFFERYFKIFQYSHFRQRRAAMVAKANESSTSRTAAYGVILTWNLFWALFKQRSLNDVGRVYLRYLVTGCLRHQRNLAGVVQFINRCVTHWHFYRFTCEATAGKLRLFNSG